MADRVLHEDPPGAEYRKVGWWCHYHRGVHGGIMCHNPLDCDVSPMWVLYVEDFHAALAAHPEQVNKSTEEIPS